MARAGKRIALVITILVVLALVIPPFINVGRYKARIVDSMSRALGRPVTFGSMSLRLLPQPGFDFDNLAIGDDPRFGAEPIIRADSVTANLRLASLWRGRLEIARLDLNYPSLNIVRSANGEWNIESLLYQASRTPTAPTSSMKPERQLRFPYIEAEDGRINFKYGLEKGVFALTNAKFALWSPETDQWRMRLEAKPVRTDIVVFDTGMIRAEGSFQRAEQLRNTPVNLQFLLERSQLGQLSRLFYGRDRGWRGTGRAFVKLSGTPADLKFQSDVAIDDFHRYDIVRGDSIRLSTQCEGAISSVTKSIQGVKCRVPLDSGQLQLTASAAGWKPQSYEVGIAASSVPMDWVIAVAKHAKRDLPDDLRATGELNGEFVLRKDNGSQFPRLFGDAKTKSFVLKSSILKQNLPLEKLEIHADSRAPKGTILVTVPPFPVPMGLPTPVAASGSISNSGYNLGLIGDGEASQMLRIARTIGIGVPKFELKGTAHLNTTISGEWKGFAEPETSGTVQVKSLIAEIPGVNAPVKIASADVVLQENSVSLRRMNASVGNLTGSGTAKFPRHCEGDSPCSSEVAVQLDEVNLDEVNRLLNPQLKKRPWYKLFGASEERSILASWNAHGQVTAKHLELKTATASKVSTEFELADGKLSLKNVQGEMFGGQHTGDWAIDFTGDRPTYEGVGKFTRVNLVQISTFMKDAWGTGTLAGSYDLKLAGSSAGDLFQSATAKGEFVWNNGTLRHFSLDGKHGSFAFPQWTGTVEWGQYGLKLVESKLRAAGGIYMVSGSVQPSRDLKLQFVRGDGTAYQVTGTLEKPQVAATPPARTAEAKLQQ